MKAFREKFAIIIIGLFVFILIITLTQSAKKSTIKENITITKSTLSYTRIETSRLLKKAVFNLLFEVKNQSLFDALLAKMENSQEDSDLEKLNINPIEAIEIFEVEAETPVMIIRMAAANPVIKTQLKWNNLYAIQDESFIYFSENKNAILDFIKDLRSQAKEIQLVSEDITRYTFENGSKQVQKIRFKKNGIYVSTNSTSKVKYNVLKPSGFHYSGVFDGKSLQTQLKKVPYLNKCHLEHISRISLNYEGFEFTDKDSVPGIPKLDLLLSFNSPTQAKPFLQQLVDLTNKKLNSNEVYFDLGANKLYFHQESPTQIYLSTQHETAFITTTTNQSLILGDLNEITRIENAGWKAAVLEMLPGFSATKHFFTEFEPIKHQVKDKNETFILKTKQNKNLYESLFTWILAI